MVVRHTLLEATGAGRYRRGSGAIITISIILSLVIDGLITRRKLRDKNTEADALKKQAEDKTMFSRCFFGA